MTAGDPLSKTPIARGLSSEEIAHTLNLSIDGVDDYRRTLMEKLGLNSVAAIVRVASAQQRRLRGVRRPLTGPGL